MTKDIQQLGYEFGMQLAAKVDYLFNIVTGAKTREQFVELVGEGRLTPTDELGRFKFDGVDYQIMPCAPIIEGTTISVEVQYCDNVKAKLKEFNTNV